MLALIPKQADLTHCDNWRGIRLLDEVRKLYAKVRQRRLQMVVEHTFLDSQCRFHNGLGCIDMISAHDSLLREQGNTITPKRTRSL